MWNFNKVVKIDYLQNYVFKIVFDDNSSGEVDFSEYIERWDVFKSLRDLKLFKSAIIDGGTIAWENGLDIAPETLYEKVSKTR